MDSTKAEYLVSLIECQDSIFSSQGHVSSIRITRFKEFEKMTISGRSDVSAMWPGKM